MSKFFNETNKALQGRARGTGVPKQADIADLVGAVKQNLQHSVPEHAAKPLIVHAGNDSLGAELAAGRLDKCGTVRLPRDNQRTLLTPEYHHDQQLAVEAYRTLRTRLMKRQSQQGTRSLALSSAAQGDGKTLTCVNLGLSYSNLQDRTVLLVDADLRTKGLSRILGLADRAGLSDVLEGTSTYASTIVRTDRPNLYVLPAGRSSLPAPELFSRAAWKELVAWSSETFQAILVDAPPIVELADTELICAACESILLVAKSGMTKRHELSKIMQQVDAKKLAGLVLNSCPHAHSSNYYYYGQA